jgi:hypothetical protein
MTRRNGKYTPGQKASRRKYFAKVDAAIERQIRKLEEEMTEGLERALAKEEKNAQ